MRVGLVQCRLETRSRAANIQAISAAVGRAAKAIPASDLVILPGAVYTEGVVAGGAVYWSVVVPAESWGPTVNGKRMGTLVCRGDGRMLALAEGPEETILYADVPLESGPAEGPVTSTVPGDHAD